jgi:hypothetical protein
VFPACLFQLTRASLARGRCACAGKPASQSFGWEFQNRPLRAPGLPRGPAWVPARRPGHKIRCSFSPPPRPSSPGRSQDRDPVNSNQPCKRSPGLTTALRLSVVLDIASLVSIKSGDDNRIGGRRHPTTPPHNSPIRSPRIPRNSGPARHRGCSAGCRTGRGPQDPSAS